MKQEVRASKARKENPVGDIMTPVMEESLELLDLLVHKVTQLLAHQALRGHLVHLDEATMANLDHRGLLDLQDRP